MAKESCEQSWLLAPTAQPAKAKSNFIASQAGQRDYYAFYMDHDHANGAQSATFSIAVPA